MDPTATVTTPRTGTRQRVSVLVAVVLAVAGVASLWLVGHSPAAGATTAKAVKPLYDVVMGDSLAAGVGASTTNNRYANVLYQHEQATFPSLQLLNLACSGATTTSVINGPGCSYATGTQLGDVEAFLRAHPKQVALLTIDIGANNVDACQVGETISATCVQSGLQHISTELPQILSGLEAAYPGLAIYAMNYYDPFLGEWLTGPAGQSVAQQSEQVLLTSLNGLLTQRYTASGAATADVATVFQSADFAPTGTYLGVTEPQNVADACNWTLFCSNNGNIHANDIGHFLVGASFAQVVDRVSVASTTLPPGSTTAKYAGALSATGGHPRYHWSLSAGSAPLPPGIRLQSAGSLVGRPTTPGHYSFTVQVVDTKLTIQSPPAPHVATATVTMTVG